MMPPGVGDDIALVIFNMYYLSTILLFLNCNIINYYLS